MLKSKYSRTEKLSFGVGFPFRREVDEIFDRIFDWQSFKLFVGEGVGYEEVANSAVKAGIH